MKKPIAALITLGLATTTVGAIAQTDTEPPSLQQQPSSEQARALAVQDWSDESSWDIPGEYLVDFHDDVTMSTIGSALKTMGVASFTPAPLADETGVVVVELPAIASRLVAALQADPRVEVVEPHARVRAFLGPDDPMYGQQWHMKTVGVEDAWSMSVGRGVTVAVIDTGIACENFGDFTKASDLVSTSCVAGRSFVGPKERANDDHGHGTHVAGTIAQSTNNALGGVGIAFGARLMPIKVLSGRGWGTTSGVAAGIRWAADQGAQVINLSLGGPRNSKVLQSAVDHARSRGAIVVAAAGNSGGSVGYPGASAGVIGVSATTQDDGLAWFSSRGKGVDIAAPGVSVLQQTICDRGRNRCEIFPTWNGTSMAAPHVAGAAALLVGLGVNDAQAVEAILGRTAKELADPGGQQFGKGRLQAGEAVAEVVRTQLWSRWLALLAMAFLAYRWARRKGAAIPATSPGFWIASVTTGVGLLFFAPWLLSRHMLWVDVLSRPLVEWDIFAGMAVHRLLPLANVMLPLTATAIFLRVRGAQPWLAGLSVGTGAYLASLIALGHLATPFGAVLTTIWCGVNVLLCLYLSSLLLRKDS